MKERFGERLKQLRLAAGYATPGALAAEVGVTEGAIRQMESGQTKSASLRVGLKLAQVLRVTPEVLAGLDELDQGNRPLPGPLQSLEERVANLEQRQTTALATAEDALALARQLLLRDEQGGTP